MRVLSVIFALLLTACIGTQESAPLCLAPSDSGTPFGQALQRAALHHGNKVTPEQLALAGLSGLNTLDPTMTITREHARIVFRVPEKPTSWVTVPSGLEISSWREKMVDILITAKQISPVIEIAPPEKLQASLIAALNEAYPTPDKVFVACPGPIRHPAMSYEDHLIDAISRMAEHQGRIDEAGIVRDLRLSNGYFRTAINDEYGSYYYRSTGAEEIASVIVDNLPHFAHADNNEQQHVTIRLSDRVCMSPRMFELRTGLPPRGGAIPLPGWKSGTNFYFKETKEELAWVDIDDSKTCAAVITLYKIWVTTGNPSQRPAYRR